LAGGGKLAKKEVNIMPFGDGTGPMGMGPMTGRGTGFGNRKSGANFLSNPNIGVRKAGVSGFWNFLRNCFRFRFRFRRRNRRGHGWRF